MFKKILVANRGEIAVRIIRACRELGIATVAIYSQADANSLHVKMADESVCIGPPPNRDSYLNIPNIVTAAIITGCDAVHPGYGNLSETVAFAENCEIARLKFIGPRPETIERMQDKAEAKQLVAKAGVPVIPGTNGVLANEAEGLKTAHKFGYPVMIKAAAGGGGRGIRIVNNDEEFMRNLPLAQAEAQSSFGRPEVYLEKFIESPRHIEMQIIADEYGNVVHLGERDCTVQKKSHQKLLEESPSIAISPALRQRIGDAAVKAAKAIGYVSAGTMEFLLDKNGKMYFMEINTRIQVEHCVTEMVTGIDLLKLQILIAAGEKLPFTQKDIQLNGHAIECRVNAEDPSRNMMACAGIVKNYLAPGGPGVRVDSHLYPGYEVPAFYDSLLAKVICWGKDRDEAIERMKRALGEMVVEGLPTTIPLFMKILDDEEFRAGTINTDFVPRKFHT
ncbi:MAG TPA: acetyl-CoA carboxylase biotin carboxylase subunit [Armatimonadota bacterium]|nr:acetyl-CoA carboxylase biotin carboxylase subunit [Armatimonadota bacterium]